MTTEPKSMQRYPRSQKPEKIIYCNWLSLMCLLINVQHVVTMFRGDSFFSAPRRRSDAEITNVEEKEELGGERNGN